MDHTGEPNKKRGKVQKKSMLSFDEDEEDEEYRQQIVFHLMNCTCLISHTWTDVVSELDVRGGGGSAAAGVGPYTCPQGGGGC